MLAESSGSRGRIYIRDVVHMARSRRKVSNDYFDSVAGKSTKIRISFAHFAG